MPALDYNAAVASLYDDYCSFSADIPYFAELARSLEGPILELMAGTGRVSVPMALAGASLTCVDLSVEMLGVLHRKQSGLRLPLSLACADVRSLPFRPGQFEHAVIPFQGLSELLTLADRSATFLSVHRALRPRGSFVCTLHNPAARLRTLDGSWHVLGEVPRTGGGALRLSLRASWNREAALVVGHQRIEEFPQGSLTPSQDLMLSLRFSLPSLEEILTLGSEAGFRPRSVVGDYSGNPYQPEVSPFVILVFEKVT